MTTINKPVDAINNVKRMEQVDIASHALSSTFTNDGEDCLSEQSVLDFNCSTVDVSRSNVVFKSRNFMFPTEEHALRSKNPAALFPRSGETLSVSFEDVVEVVNIDLLDEEGMVAEESCKYYLKTGFFVQQFLDNIEDYDLNYVQNRVDASEYWANHDIVDVNERHKISNVSAQSLSGMAEFKSRLESIESCWEQGGCVEDDDNSDPTAFLFPNGDREFVEEMNKDLISVILKLTKISKENSVNTEKVAEVFTGYASIRYLIKTMEEVGFRAKMNHIYTHRFIDPSDLNYLENWEEARDGIIRVFQLFEKEVATFEKVESEDFMDIKGVQANVLNRLHGRVLMKSEHQSHDESDSEDEEPMHITASRYHGNKKQDVEDYQCLLSERELSLRKKSVLKIINGSEEWVNQYYDNDSGKRIKTPIVVPETWRDLDLLGFLRNPLYSWNVVKLHFLKSYYDLMNVGLVLSMMNDNPLLLTLLRSKQVPQAFKPEVLTNSRFAASSKTGLVPLLVYRRDEHSHNRKKFLDVSSSTFFLNPLVRADLHASFQEHCSSTQSCSGHSGMLLVRMIRMNKFHFATLLIANGVNINSKCCMGNIKTLKWGTEDPPRVFGVPEVIHNLSEPKKHVKTSADFQILRSLDGVRDEQNKKGMNIPERLKKYAQDSGILNDAQLREVTKKIKVCPLSVAVEMAIDTGNNEGVDFLLEKGARVWRADSTAFTGTVLILKKLAAAFKDENHNCDGKSSLFSGRSTRRLTSIARMRFSGNFMSSISSRSLLSQRSNISIESVKRKDNSLDHTLDRALAGLKLPKKAKNLVRLSTDPKFNNNLICLKKIVERAADELKVQMGSTAATTGKEAARIDRKVKVALRTTWLYFCLMHEEWEVARMLTASGNFNGRKRQYSMFSKNSTAQNAARRFDWVTCQSIKKTVDMLLLGLSKSNVPHTAQILNALYFILKEFDVMFTWNQCRNLFTLLVHGVLNVPSPRAGVSLALRKLILTKQMKHALGLRLTTNNVLYSMGDAHWNADEHERAYAWILNSRKELSIQLFANGITRTAEAMITREFFDDALWMRATLRMVTLGNYSPSVVPFVFSLANQCSHDMKQDMDDVFFDSLKHEGLSHYMLQNCEGCLTRDNAATFLHIQLTIFPETPDFEPEVAGEFSMLTTLMTTVDMIENNEPLKSQKTEIYSELLEKMKTTDRCWADGLGYIFDNASFDPEEELVPFIGAFVQSKRTQYFNYDKDNLMLTIAEQETETVLDSSTSIRIVSNDDMKDVTVSEMM